MVTQAGDALDEKAFEHQTDGLGVVTEMSGDAGRTPALPRQQKHLYPIPLGRREGWIATQSLDRLQVDVVRAMRIMHRSVHDHGLSA
jgi:hypothetical protein